jgi:hypothetical protein
MQESYLYLQSFFPEGVRAVELEDDEADWAVSARRRKPA